MKMGQLTIDFLIALTVALFVLTALYSVIRIQTATQNELNIQSQLDQIAQKTAALVTTTQILADKNFKVSTKISGVSFLNSRGSIVTEFPDVHIDSSSYDLNVSINVDGKLYSAKSKFYANSKTIINVSDGLMVITNE